MKKPTVKASAPSERILVQDILNFVQGVIIEEQRAGRAIEDEYQSATGAALDEDIPPLPFPEVPAKNGKVSALAAQRRATVRQVHIEEAIAEVSAPTTTTTAETTETDVRKLAKVFKKKKVRRCRERVAALIKVKRYLEEMLAE